MGLALGSSLVKLPVIVPLFVCPCACAPAAPLWEAEAGADAAEAEELSAAASPAAPAAEVMAGPASASLNIDTTPRLALLCSLHQLAVACGCTTASGSGR